jgi:hypothetical protein
MWKHNFLFHKMWICTLSEKVLLTSMFAQFRQKASSWINKTLLLIKQHITYMNISRYVNIDKFVNIRYILYLMPTNPRFVWHVTINTHIFFWPCNSGRSENSVSSRSDTTLWVKFSYVLDQMACKFQIPYCGK